MRMPRLDATPSPCTDTPEGRRDAVLDGDRRAHPAPVRLGARGHEGAWRRSGVERRDPAARAGRPHTARSLDITVRCSDECAGGDDGAERRQAHIAPNYRRPDDEDANDQYG